MDGLELFSNCSAIFDGQDATQRLFQVLMN